MYLYFAVRTMKLRPVPTAPPPAISETTNSCPG